MVWARLRESLDTVQTRWLYPQRLQVPLVFYRYFKDRKKNVTARGHILFEGY